MFNNFIGIDWSGAATPVKSENIALAKCTRSSSAAPTALTHKLSRTDVYEYILGLKSKGERSLVGIDCNLGYYHGIGKQQFGPDADYLMLWNEVERLCADKNNFFAGPYWQDDSTRCYFWTHRKQPSWFNVESLRRETESLAAKQGLGIPESPFKLIGAKQVGKGGLAGMRMVLALKQQLKDDIAIWPFEDPFSAQVKIVLTEIYPRLFIRHAGFGNAKIRELSQLNASLRHFGLNEANTTYHLSDHVTDALVSSAGLRWFCSQYEALSRKMLPSNALQFEGWIFGVKPE